MSVITFTTDKGYASAEVSVMKFQLQQAIPNIVIADLFHDIKPLDFQQAAHTIHYFYDEFPAGSIHWGLVDTEFSVHRRWLIAAYRHSFILAPDNGLLPVIQPDFSFIKSPMTDDLSRHAFKDFTEISQRMINNPNYFNQLSAAENIVEYEKTTLSVTQKDSMLKGWIVYIDRQGNLVTNITKEIFEEARNGKRFEIVLTRQDKHNSLQQNYNDVKLEQSELICRFNRLGRLEIALNRENASQLLGLKYGKPVMIEFY